VSRIAVRTTETTGPDADAVITRSLVIWTEVERHVLKHDVTARSLAEWQGLLNPPEPRSNVLLTGKLDGSLVGYASLAWTRGASTGWVYGGVLPSHRSHGLGTQLMAEVESLARAMGLVALQVAGIHGDHPGPRLEAAAGIGSIPAKDPGAKFLARHGYRLEQVRRLNVLDLPVPASRLDALRREAELASGLDYRLHTWVTPHPERWVADIASLQSRMATDAPSAGLDVAVEPWDVDRIRAKEQRALDAGTVHLTAAAEYIPSGRLVAFTGLTLADDRSRPVRQGPTLVVREHRGHRLGLRVKLANLELLAQQSPQSTVMLTGNAAENRHMLAINETIGYYPIGARAAWKKTLGEIP
jgi:GNAT superfamily N-acetyltransferase